MTIHQKVGNASGAGIGAQRATTPTGAQTINDEATGVEREQEIRNVENAKWVIDHCGKVLPVTNLFDTDSQESFDPTLAVTCVAYDADSDHPEGKWLCLGNLEPGDIWRKTNEQVPAQGRAGYN